MFLWIVLLLGLGSYCYYLSRLQPFPEKGSRFSMFLFAGALILWIASTSPEGSGEDLPASISEFLGGDGTHFLNYQDIPESLRENMAFALRNNTPALSTHMILKI